ncbi:deoxyribonuclease HsdR [Ureaplasma diversum]|uniref:type I site-specific deoxyribonuclease n=1 Tax=Ureaplasma diversum TaxID=42094 RepID=A0A0C5RNX4_9BACT|nr:type I restriction endonuclease [Ureaplasma diversum]AJQ45174.1 deoxyribonuclease HsdR [Ureaplasma diversum]
MAENKFNEDTRVKLPALVHLTRLGYEYLPIIHKDQANDLYDPDTNILLQVFEQQFKKLNPNHKNDPKQILSEIKMELNNDDLGQSFYQRLLSIETRLIDFENIENNVFHCTTEFSCENGGESFRPDITLFINGLPLAFIEVKIPNNPGGIVAESERMNNERLPNKKFRRFLNITQLMIFSNNMEYASNDGVVPIEGAFYSTIDKKKAFFNCFREEPINNNEFHFYENYSYKDIDPEIEKLILSNSNYHSLHKTKEYQSNLDITTPTNRIITSLCSFGRLLFLIKYGIAYINSTKEVDGSIVTINQKHIMRYQQMFATLAIKEKLDKNIKSGIIWHTQGSGKTALSYFLTRYINDYFAFRNKVTKFYFIVDRIDLLEQAKQEFESRGLLVKTANTREELMQQFRNYNSKEGNSGNLEITVVNIQRFAEDNTRVELPKYATNLQRVFIIDEAHRGYKPEGSFLSNLFNADPNAIKIALTGTPLLKEEKASWKIFGDYIHTYYYDKSVKDGYTLKIIIEDIQTFYKEKLTKIYNELDRLVQKKDIKKSYIIEHQSYIKELTKYIINDLNDFRIRNNDNTIGAMIICETAAQAQTLFNLFEQSQTELNNQSTRKSNLKVDLILHNVYDKETRKRIINDFKKNMTVDILIVYNMLLTGFDAPRLKRLYLGRKLKDHNLLQAITRVNRPYKDNRYGYIIDFADIKENFEQTNAAYLQELNRFNDADINISIDTYNDILEDPSKLIANIENSRELVFKYTTDNLEDFSKEISRVEEKEELLELKKSLLNARDSFNIVKTFGNDQLKKQFNTIRIDNLAQMISIISKRIDIINQKKAIENSNDVKYFVNELMSGIGFKFQKSNEYELTMLSEEVLNEKHQKIISIFNKNEDKEDPEFISLWKAFIELLNKKGFSVSNKQDYHELNNTFDFLLKQLEKIQNRNEVLAKKYNNDYKYPPIHKRIKDNLSLKDTQIHLLLKNIKEEVDKNVYYKNDLLKNEYYFEQLVSQIVVKAVKKHNLDIKREDRKFIETKIKTEYINEYNRLNYN